MTKKEKEKKQIEHSLFLRHRILVNTRWDKGDLCDLKKNRKREREAEKERAIRVIEGKSKKWSRKGKDKGDKTRTERSRAERSRAERSGTERSRTE